MPLLGATSAESAATPVSGPAPRGGKGRRWSLLLGGVVLALGAYVVGRYLWAESCRRSAERALNRYDFDEACGEFERALEAWPYGRTTRLEAARAARRANLLERAEGHLSAWEAGGGGSEASLERLLIRAQRGDLGEVDGLLLRLVHEGHPEGVSILEALARGYDQVLLHRPAEGALNLLLERAPDHPWAHFWRGKVRETTGRMPAAMIDYRDAVRLAPGRVEFRARLAAALLLLAQPGEAWEHFQRLLRQAPSSADVLLGSARSLRALGKPQQALEHLDALLRGQPDNVEAWAERGLVEGDLGNRDEALRCLRRAFALNPESYETGLALYGALKAGGQPHQAAEVWKRLGELKRKADRYAELSVLLAKDPRNADLRCEMGRLCLRDNAEGAALRWFFGVLQYDQSHAPTHAALADYYQKKGDAERSSLHRSRAGR